MASSIARGRVRMTTMAAVAVLRKMAAIFQLSVWHAAFVYSALSRSDLLWSIDTCQSKLSADQYHVTISWRGLKFNLSRSRVFKIDCWSHLTYCKQGQADNANKD